jgi:transposase-like protein
MSAPEEKITVAAEADLKFAKAAKILSLLMGHRSSHETLSALTDQVLETAECFRRRPLPPEMAFVYLHGLALKLCQEEEGVLRVSVYVAWG